MLQHHLNTSFKQWFNKHYDYKNSEFVELMNLFYSDKDLKDDIQQIITYLNHLNVHTKERITINVNESGTIGIKMNIGILSLDDWSPVMNGLVLFKQNLKTDKILFNICYLDQQEYDNYRSVEHGVTA